MGHYFKPRLQNPHSQTRVKDPPPWALSVQQLHCTVSAADVFLRKQKGNQNQTQSSWTILPETHNNNTGLGTVCRIPSPVWCLGKVWPFAARLKRSCNLASLGKIFWRLFCQTARKSEPACWFSHDVTKIHTTKLSILLRFYFHGVLQQLKTNFQTNFRFRRVLGFVIVCAFAWRTIYITAKRAVI